MGRLRGVVGGGSVIGRTLAWQSILIAVVCMAVDGASAAMHGLPLHTPVGALLAVLVVLVDAALALPVRLSGWVAATHAVAVVVIAVVVRVTVNLHGTGGRAVSVGESHVGALIAGYRVGAWLRRWPSLLSLGVLVAGMAVSRCFSPDADVLSIVMVAATNAVLPWLVGRYTTGRRAYIDELSHRRENEQRDADAAVAAAVTRERSAIARDLHDVISHHVSAIGMHAGAARLGLTARGAGDPVTGSLSAVEAASRAAMVDLRKLLDVLHGNSDSANQPGLANLDELVTGVRPTGPAVRLTVHGGSRPLPGSLDVALYRVAQEMLTNALRHGDGSTVDLEIRYRDDAVTLAARNGIGRRAPVVALTGDGRGLAGIRTRAAMFDGSVNYGPDDSRTRWETSVTVSTRALEEAS
ncbi:histidine kinase [Asanoa sp. NPDC049573]|uniref:sensor histidine kinase n=1 Tax=Asanoa sp. NPDC049573 TaxID=3155396 RepID=UPI00343B5DCA